MEVEIIELVVSRKMVIAHFMFQKLSSRYYSVKFNVLSHQLGHLFQHLHIHNVALHPLPLELSVVPAIVSFSYVLSHQGCA